MAEFGDMFGSDDEQPTSTAIVSSVQAANIELIDNIGGGRGVFACHALPAGTLIILEWPVVTWEELDLSVEGDMITLVTRILCNPEAHSVTKSLHPQNLSDASQQEIESALQFFSDQEQIKELLSMATIEEISRIYLCVKHNGFGSGLYKDLSMVNHSCDPNSVKFEPRTGSRGASEIWTTRDIRNGEEITISYCSPIESLSLPIRTYLFDQHCFECNCKRCVGFKHYSFPSALSADDVEGWDCWIADSEFELQMLKYNISDLGILNKMGEECNRLFSQMMIHHRDIFQPDFWRLQARNRMLFASIAMKKLSLYDQSTNIFSETSKMNIERSQLTEPVKDLLECTAEILRWQRKYLGGDHPDLITSLTDMQNAVELLTDLTSLKDVDAVLNTVNWDDVLSSRAYMVTTINVKSLRFIIKQEITRLKDLYSVVKRCPNAVKVIKQPGLSFWGLILLR